jgi:hypothetical protein
MSNASGPEVSTIETLEMLQRTSPVAEAVRKVAELGPFLLDLEVIPDEAQLEDEARQLVATADAMWPWLDRDVLVSGRGYVTKVDRELGSVMHEPVVMQDVRAISAGFVLLSDISKPLGEQYSLVHLLRVPASELRTDSDPRAAKHIDEQDMLDDEGEDQADDNAPDTVALVKADLDAVTLESLDLEGPADQAMLQYFYADLMGEIDVAALNEASLTTRLRRLAKLDLSAITDMPVEHIRELMRYITSLELFKDRYPYKIGHAVMLSMQSEQGDEGIDDTTDDDRGLTLLAQVGGFTLAQIAEVDPETGNITSDIVLALNANGLKEDGTPFAAILPITPKITASSLWPPRSRKSAQ